MNTLDQIPTRTDVPNRVPPSASWTFLQVGLRLLLAAALSAAVVATAVAGMMVTSAPKWVSLALEPFSLLLLPGALIAWAEAAYNRLDFSGSTVIHVSLVFYFFLFALLLLQRGISPRQPRRTPARRSR